MEGPAGEKQGHSGAGWTERTLDAGQGQLVLVQLLGQHGQVGEAAVDAEGEVDGKCHTATNYAEKELSQAVSAASDSAVAASTGDKCGVA